MKKVAAVAVVLLGLPVMLFVYQPAWQLGSLGLALGGIGMTLSPLVVLFALLYTAHSLWKRD